VYLLIAELSACFLYLHSCCVADGYFESKKFVICWEATQAIFRVFDGLIRTIPRLSPDVVN